MAKLFDVVSRILQNKFVKSLAQKGKAQYPNAYVWLWGLIAQVDDTYTEFTFPEGKVRFWEAARSDRRGIGRVALQIRNYLTQRDIGMGENEKLSMNVVNFFPSILFCPRKLPKHSVVIVHDVIPLKVPNFFDTVHVALWKKRFKLIAEQADLIITVSETSKKDIHDVLGIREDIIKVVKVGVSAIDGHDFDQLNNFIFKDHKYIVALGTTDRHKNIEIILNALQDASLTDISLVVIGDSSRLEPLIPETIRSRVYLLGKINDQDVGLILKNAMALVFPSVYEGFGLPPFEAALLRCPIILSKRPAMTELWSTSECYFVEPTDCDGWVRAINLARKQDVEKVNKAYCKAKEYLGANPCESIYGYLIQVLDNKGK